MDCVIINLDDIKQGTLLLIDDIIYKVIEVTHSMSGKHGIHKLFVRMINIITNEEKTEYFKWNDTTRSPNVKRQDYTIINIDINDLKLLNDKDEPIYGITLNDNELCNKLKQQYEQKDINKEFSIQVIHYLDRTIIEDYKIRTIKVVYYPKLFVEI